MMASAQIVRPKGAASCETKQAEGLWCSVFPMDLSTEEQSLIFVKKLVAIGISTITYLRMIFPETSYKDKFVEGLNLKVLMDESACEGANKLISWVTGCFDAIEKNYLREMILGIYVNEEDPNCVLEKYTFKFSYTESEVVLNHMFERTNSQTGVVQNYEVKVPTFKMIRTIIMLMQSLDPLPTKVYMSMKLYYYDHLTPHEYEPPGFRQVHDNPFTFEQNSVNLKVGDVKTGFHSVKLRVAVDASQFALTETDASTFTADGKVTEGKNEENEYSGEELQVNCGKNTTEDVATKENPVRHRRLRQRVASMYLSQTEAKAEVVTSKTLSSSFGLSEEEPVSPLHSSYEVAESAKRQGVDEDANPTQWVPGTPPLHENAIESMSETPLATPKLSDVMSNPSSTCCSVRSVSVDLASTFSKEFPVRCPCQVHNDDGLMILCDVCGYWQHGACFTILEESQAPSKHYCERCADPPSLCTDPRLSLADAAQVEATCLYRRALVIARHLDRKVSSAVMAHRLGVDISVGTRIIQKLTSDKVVRIGPSGSAKIVDKDVLFKIAYPKYFNQNPKENTTPEKNSVSNSQVNQLETSTNSLSLLGFASSRDSQLDSQMSVEILSETFAETSPNNTGKNARLFKKISQTKELQASEPEKENANPSEHWTKTESKLSRRKRKLISFEEKKSVEVCGSPLDLSSYDVSTLAPKKKTSEAPGLRI